MGQPHFHLAAHAVEQGYELPDSLIDETRHGQLVFGRHPRPRRAVHFIIRPLPGVPVAAEQYLVDVFACLRRVVDELGLTGGGFSLATTDGAPPFHVLTPQE